MTEPAPPSPPASAPIRRSQCSRLEQRGGALVELPLLLALLLLPVGFFLVQVPPLIEHQRAARDAATEVARAAALSSHEDFAAEQLVRRVETAHGLGRDRLRLIELADGGEAGQPVTATVEVRLPGVVGTWAGGLGAGTWRASHTERVPDFGADR